MDVLNRQAPNIIGMYFMGAWIPRRVAEFRLLHGRVVLTLIDPHAARIATQWYTDGIGVRGSSRRITADDGKEFMSALLQPFPMSYYRLVDETASAGGYSSRSA
ncbi:hypothetical protein [Nocardia sputorum]|uniref:hypothetical protein n=1 Tax=Nocardia sputorum TaxID=2984338 RepID=UPI00249380ED|nr:hypothetical protein [Nocardia sputorum]